MRRRQERAGGYEAGSTSEGYQGAPPSQPQASGQQAAGQPQQQPAGTATGYAQPGTEQGRAEYGRGGYAPERYRDRDTARAGTGHLVLASVLMILSGMWSFLEGIVAILRDSFFVTASTLNGNYIYHFNLHGWGWLHLSLGIALFAAGVCVLLGQTWAKILGIVVAVFSALAAFMFLPFFPIWSIIVIAIDVFIIWALATSGRRAAI